MSGSGRRGRKIVRLRPASYSTPDEARLRLFVRLDGLGKPQGAVVANLNYDDHGFLYRGSRGGSESVRNTGNPQHRPGSQFTSLELTELLKNHQIQISMDGKECWRDNVFVELIWQSIIYEEVYLHAYESVSAAKSGITRYLSFYNVARPHSTLDGRTPDGFYFANLPGQKLAA